MNSYESAFPVGESVTSDPDRRTVSLDEADDILDSLTSDTARAVLMALHENPNTASDLAGQIDTSIQNIQHHLNQLQAAELVEVADTWYSEKGREMKVYVLATDPIVIHAGESQQRSPRREPRTPTMTD